MRIILTSDDQERHEQRLEELKKVKEAKHQLFLASQRIHAHRMANHHARKLYYKGLLPACQIPDKERASLKKAYFKAGGEIHKVQAATAFGALISPYWTVDKYTLIKGIREQVESGRTLEAAIAGTGLTHQEIILILEEEGEAESSAF